MLCPLKILQHWLLFVCLGFLCCFGVLCVYVCVRNLGVFLFVFVFNSLPWEHNKMIRHLDYEEKEKTFLVHDAKMQCLLPVVPADLHNQLCELSWIRVVSSYTSNWKLWMCLDTASFFYQLPLLVSLQCWHLNMAITEIRGELEKLVFTLRLFGLACSMLVFVAVICMGQSKYLDIVSCFLLSMECANVKNCLWLA